MTIDITTAKLLLELLRELSSEMDLHYEDAELPATAKTIQVMKAAAAAVKESGFEPPEVYRHVLRRFVTATQG